MKFLLTENEEFFVGFERHEREFALDFLESIEPANEVDAETIEQLILTLSNKPKLTLIQ